MTGPDMVVLFEPLIDDGPGLPCRFKPFGVEYLATQRSVEAFIIAILAVCPG